MKITLKKIGKLGFSATTECGHTILLDGSPDHGGDNQGPRPMEMVLVALGSCSGIDVSLILQKSRQQVSDISIEVEAERADSIPAVFTSVHVSYNITGIDLDPARVERAVSLSMDKYCSVTRMLEPSVNITHSYTVTDI
jgi:putative redox protein